MIVKQIGNQEKVLWDCYADGHPQASFTHLSGCAQAIRRVYGLQTYCFGAFRENDDDLKGDTRPVDREPKLVGLLPLTHMQHFLFGNQLVSMPFFDTGGIIADDHEAEQALIVAAFKLAARLKVPQIELRMASAGIDTATDASSERSGRMDGFACNIFGEKVRMILPLFGDAETLMKSFKSKLRSQIRKPMRDGLAYRVGGLELLDDFYRIFCVNMRDLGSPVHSKSFLEGILTELGPRANIVLVYHEHTPLAASIIIGFRNVLFNPWASALQSNKKLNPNMLLYWAMLEYGCNHGFQQFDFGRSTPGEGTYRFKEQWGARPAPLHWRIYSQGPESGKPAGNTKSRFGAATRYWKKMPLPLTRVLGPLIRKHISL